MAEASALAGVSLLAEYGMSFAIAGNYVCLLPSSTGIDTVAVRYSKVFGDKVDIFYEEKKGEMRLAEFIECITKASNTKMSVTYRVLNQSAPVSTDPYVAVDETLLAISA